MIFLFPPLSIASQARYSTSSVNTMKEFLSLMNIMNEILSALCQNAFRLEECLFIFTNQNARQAEISTMAMNNKTLGRAEQSYLQITSAQRPLAKDRLSIYLWYGGILLRVQALVPQDKISKSNEIQVVKGRLVHKIFFRDGLQTSWGTCLSRFRQGANRLFRK